MLNNILVGFVGEGEVLEYADKLCRNIGYQTRIYSHLHNINCDVLFAMRYNKIIPFETIQKIPMGAIMIHYSKLPQYRGYYPINQAIRNNETEIGITMFYADSGIDTGDIIDQKIIQIEENERVDDIYHRCNHVAKKMFENNVLSILDNTTIRKKQIGNGSVFKKEDLTPKLDLTRDPLTIHNSIRSLTGKDQERAYIEDDHYRVYFDRTTLVKK